MLWRDAILLLYFYKPNQCTYIQCRCEIISKCILPGAHSRILQTNQNYFSIFVKKKLKKINEISSSYYALFIYLLYPTLLFYSSINAHKPLNM